MADAKKKRTDKIDFSYNFKLYLSFLKPYTFPLVVLLFIIFVVESISVFEKFLFKMIIDKGSDFTTGILAADAFVAILLGIAIVFVIAQLVRVVGQWWRLHLVNIIESSSIADLKRKFFNHVLGLSYSFHTTHRTGSLISRIVRGGSAMERMTDSFIFNFAPLILQLVVATASLIYFDFVSAVVVMATIITFLGYNLIINNVQKSASLKANNAEDFEKASISDVFMNVDSIKYFGKELPVKERFARISEKTKKAFVKFWNYFRWLDSGQSLILGAGTLLLLYLSLIQFLNHQMTLGTVTFIYTVYGTLIGNLFGFVWGIRTYYRAMADLDALFRYSKIENEVKNAPDAKELKINEGEIEFRNVSFNYKKRKIFSNFSLKVPKGKKIALVGPSGSGKSTLVKLLYRLYDVNNGEILIDGKNINNFKQESLRSELSVVLQECMLFNDTIYNNIAFSNPKATRRDVLKAMKFAQLDKIVKTFPLKENTIVGERGIKLSGGEKQRVSIARAILANKKVLVLDEATSSLDSAIEHEIQKDLEKLMKNRTSIIIAHRLSTVMKADFIVVLDKGKLVQMSTHKQLVKQSGMYKKLWSLQKGGYLK
jgi:ATP-binding cassette subfamily B protein